MKEKPTIIFLIHTFFTDRDYKRFGIKIFQKKGFKVEIWTLGSLLIKNFDTLEKETNTNMPIKQITTLHNFHNQVIKTPKNTFFIYIFGKHFSFINILTKEKKRYIHFISADTLAPHHKVFHLIFFLKKYIQYIFELIALQIGIISSASLIFLSSKKSFKNNFFRYYTSKKTKKIFIHSFDYDLYLENKKKNIKEENIAVFLDEYDPFHNDHKISGKPYPLSPEYYYKQLNHYFNFVEKNTNLKVVIAAHPRSKYENHPPYYKDRPVIKGQTVELIRKSKLVIMQSSTAISFATLYFKPITFISFKRFNNHYLHKLIKNTANYFQKEPVFVDQDPYPRITFSVNKKIYKKYKQEYIKKENTEEKLFWDIASDEILKIK